MTSTDQSTPLSQPSKSCAIVQRISDSNSSVIFRLILDDSESAQEVYVFMRHSCLLSSMITVEKKVHLNLKNITLKVESFAGRKFRDFANFFVDRES